MRGTKTRFQARMVLTAQNPKGLLASKLRQRRRNSIRVPKSRGVEGRPGSFKPTWSYLAAHRALRIREDDDRYLEAIM